ncbi:complement C1q-like protein 4 isoform X2 [Melanotaenia boesemani]|uniref:complement C1q-like protein 4 isoform X2 n=1 Tax=Melanotaenia boesemani TaxID=1250792 RepID=UPI001C05833F|nr:complement C1q-like protein 4 isoform X2 [Melanotaenia boesemani]
MMSCRFLVVLLFCGLVHAQGPPDHRGHQGPPDHRGHSLESRVDFLEKKRGERVKQRIAFSAGLVNAQEWTTLGPFTQDKTLEFKKVVTNVGKAYSNETGIFTAPVKGVYYFQLTGVVGSTGELHAGVKKNGENKFAIYQKAGTQASASNSMLLELEEGDRVFAQLWSGKTIADQGRLSTFSGFLVFPM